MTNASEAMDRGFIFIAIFITWYSICVLVEKLKKESEK